MGLDVEAADKHFGPKFFNDVWAYLDKETLTADEADSMIHCAHASFHHWTRIPSQTPSNLAIGYWQLARAYEKAGLAEACSRYADRCLAVAEQEGDPALLTNGNEVVARAAALAGDRAKRDAHVTAAKEALARVESEEDRKIYAEDVNTIP